MKFKTLILFFCFCFLASCTSTNNKNEIKKNDIVSNKEENIISWNSGTYIETQDFKQCISLVFDEYKNYLSINFSKNKNKNKNNITIQFKSFLDINNKGYILADIIYLNNNLKIKEQRVKMKKYKDINNIFYLNSNNTTESSIKNIINDISKYKKLKFIIYDKNWVTYEYNFSLSKSKESIHKNAKKCL